MTKPSYRFSHRQSVGLVLLCTVFGVIAQFFIKTSTIGKDPVTLMSILTNVPLWIGLATYGVSTALLILALRDGELSLLYPVLSLTYVGVVTMSIIAFREEFSAHKAIGIAIVCLGVALLGKGSSRAE